MSFCPKCGNEIGDWMFCNKCGININDYLAADTPPSSNTADNEETVEEAVPESTQEVRKCPKCGNEVGDWAFCNKCGINVEEYTPPKQATPFINSATKGTDFFSEFTPTSIDVETASDNPTDLGSSTPLDNSSRSDYQAPQPQTYRYTSSKETTTNTNTKTSVNKKPMIIAASIIGVLVVSVIALVIALTTSKSHPVKNVTDNSNEISYYDDNDAAYSDTVTESYILMPNCENKKYSTVKPQLEKIGLVIEENYEFSDEVEKGYVIYQMDAEGSQLSKGDSVYLIISKGSDKCPYDYEQKLTVTASASSSYATAVLYEWQEGDWQKIATYDATVGSNGIGNTREGSSTSPKGIHKLGVVLSSSSISTNMDTYSATKNTCVIDDTGSSYYNQIMEKSSVPSGTHYDNIGKGLTDGTTYATIYIEHNGSGFSSTNVVSGNGSAIGLRGQNGSLSPTYGDVDISASDMRDLLSKLDYNKNPVIELKTK